MFKRFLNTFLTALLFVLVIPFLIIFLFFIVLQKLLFENWTIWKSSQTESQNSKLLGIPFYNNSIENAIVLLEQDLSFELKKTYLFINPHAMNISMRDPSLYSIFKKNDRNLPDGIGIKIAGYFQNYNLVQNLNGTDLFPFVADMMVKEGRSLFLLGAELGVAEVMKKKVVAKWPELKVVGTHNGYFEKEKETKKVIENINSKNADVLFVAFGMPIQEKWINENRDKLNAKVVFALGGLFDFYSDSKPRAPKAWRQIGMEWAYRLINEPGRLWKRYLIGNPLFMVHVLKWRYLGFKK